MVESVVTFGTTTSNGPLMLGLPASDPASHGRTPTSKPSPRIVMPDRFSLVARMESLTVGRGGRDVGGRFEQFGGVVSWAATFRRDAQRCASRLSLTPGRRR